MKAFALIIVAAMLGGLVVSCGESAKERQAREAAEAQRVHDSIAQVQALQDRLKQHRLDSIAATQQRTARIATDSAIRAKLLPAFIEEKNSDASGADLYMTKTAPRAHMSNHAYLSFTVDNGIARELNINICYNGSDWLNIQRCSLMIDGDESVEISIGEISTNVNDNLSCSEWFSAPLFSSTLDKLMEAKSVKVKLFGDEKNKEFSLNARQIADIQKTIELFRAFGG
ncbi:MAG: hypothetical protein HDR89_02455 [Bacteroides sp.]|nr:hypothetical protein [Bacteroides sp.]